MRGNFLFLIRFMKTTYEKTLETGKSIWRVENNHTIFFSLTLLLVLKFCLIWWVHQLIYREKALNVKISLFVSHICQKEYNSLQREALPLHTLDTLHRQLMINGIDLIHSEKKYYGFLYTWITLLERKKNPQNIKLHSCIWSHFPSLTFWYQKYRYE